MRLVLLFLSVISASVMAQPKEVFWEDLIPEGYVPPPVSIEHGFEMAQQNLGAPVVTKFNNTQVKIPGFVVPLEGVQDTVTEFLLVPFFGACIHVPPPPPNQIVYVKMAEGVPIVRLSDVVWVVGMLSTDGWTGDLASVGYTLKGETILPYEG